MFLESKLAKLTIAVSDIFSVRSCAAFCRTILEIWHFLLTIDVSATVTRLQPLHWKDVS